ncbi:hypothetical protein HKD37_12G034661 [Glycine soja]
MNAKVLSGLLYKPKNSPPNSDIDDVSYDGDAPNTDENVIKHWMTTMEKVIHARNKGITFKVGWNERGQPIDPNRNMLVSYISVISQQIVPVTSNNWKLPTLKVVKENIWKDIQTTFIVDNSCQRWVLKEANKLCRNFRTYLTKNNVYDENGSVDEHPPQIYPFISKGQWKAFVAKRQCIEFKETISQTTSHEQLQDLQDKLSQPLNVLEYPGCVRPLLLNHVKFLIKYVIELDVLLPLPIEDARVMVVGDAIGAFVAWTTNFIDLVSMGISSCSFYLSSPTHHVVGKGKVYNRLADKKLHNRPLPLNHVKVLIKYVIKLDALLPLPIKEAGVMVPGKSKGEDSRKTNELDTKKQEIAKLEHQESSLAVGANNLPMYCKFVDMYVKDKLQDGALLNIDIERNIFARQVIIVTLQYRYLPNYKCATYSHDQLVEVKED